ncbi:asialoglycoprotein receptor 2-like isoform 2-T2 [Anomaloglossus baeobatrachus]|uniref:asialoglycoprotein receptor 2-like isoform X2 n=1 Tax=Anomaloglossus baeobatrachus TaxID=238106 RepID=UPI003F4F7F5B
MDKLRPESMCSYFKDRPVIITYGLLALSFILVIVLFVTVHSQNTKSDQKDLASRDDMVSVNNTVNSLVEKLKTVEFEAKKKTTCEIGWNLFEGKCYFFSNSQSNWFRARTMCVLKSADLVVINNENEQKFISGKKNQRTYWIGLTDAEAEGNWTWVDGSDYKISYKNWMPNEPNSYRGGEEDCGQVWKEGKWNDLDCHDRYQYAICEKKL